MIHEPRPILRGGTALSLVQATVLQIAWRPGQKKRIKGERDEVREKQMKTRKT